VSVPFIAFDADTEEQYLVLGVVTRDDKPRFVAVKRDGEASRPFKTFVFLNPKDLVFLDLVAAPVSGNFTVNQMPARPPVLAPGLLVPR